MIRYSGWTHTGRVRKNNEDHYQIAPLTGEGLLFLVADGIGGSAGGEVASRLAVETAVDRLVSTSYKDDKECREEIKTAVKAAHSAVLNRAKADPVLNGMGTTLTLLALINRHGWVAHVGDSRAYQYREGKLVQITQDHSLAQEWVRNGKISEEEALFHPYRNMLTRALGVEPLPDPDMISLDLKPGDRILLCSDGLSNMVSDARLEEILGSVTDMEYLCALLGQEALNRGGHDNITLIGVLVEEEKES